MRVVEVPEALLRAVSTVETPQGMLAVCRTPDTAPPETLPEGRLLVLDGVQDPGNVGTVWRTADAFGAAGLFLLPGCAEPFAPKTVRATMGACFRLPVWEGTLEDLTGLLARSAVSLYAAALRDDTEDIRSVPLGSAAVVIGSEGGGVPAGAGRLPGDFENPHAGPLRVPQRRRGGVCGALGGLALSQAAPADGPTPVGPRAGAAQNKTTTGRRQSPWLR